MRIEFAPLYRSTVGFDRMLDMLDNSAAKQDWPPYNIEREGENQYRISMAVAGFGPSEIELTQHGTSLLVTGQKKEEKNEREMLHQGIAFRQFKQTFNLADHVKVASANMENGLLSIELVREVPEQLKPRRIDVRSSEGAISSQNSGDNKVTQIEGRSERQKVA